ncbi:HAD family hydrolase [Isachenkonia alkalipeptolytica]|uniref:HAD family hydrolase n=1 Tax=Isachenkonia alkalipeptolytica TaxID=2565777 RepID=A0AA43XJP1_9CLOT|nr:HAD family hydrolase [Isachenkonia alkalipeptolytica]NBG88007.1 HAD family hydrolase [Isachenkonia alkalipeptolytica]
MFKNIKTLFFDYDGTLHFSEKIYIPAFRRAQEFLIDEGYLKEKDLSDQEVTRFLGLIREEMWEAYMPELPKAIQNQAGSILGREMEALIRRGKAELYPGTLETLRYLKNKGYRLVFLSNCGDNYLRNAQRAFPLEEVFEEFFTAEAFGYIPKHEILGKVLDRFPKQHLMIGDRKKDIDAGVKNQIPTIGCTYGYGTEEELEEGDLLIGDIQELKNYL